MRSQTGKPMKYLVIIEETKNGFSTFSPDLQSSAVLVELGICTKVLL
jgi:hypothetical protein